MPSAARSSARGARRSAPIFAALGDETRLLMLSRLAQSGPMSITSLTAGTGVTRQAITKHLRRMQEAGLLHASRLGRERVWEVDPASLEEAERHLRAISDQWDAALGRLKAFVES